MGETQTRVAVAMIARDNAGTIAGPLQDALDAGVSELVVVDTGSTDDTASVAQSLGARVLRRRWDDDFADARNHAIDCAQSEWVLFLDSIDRISDTVAMYKYITQDLPLVRADAILIPVLYGVGQRAHTVDNVKLLRKSSGLRFRFPIHENIDVTGHDVYRAPAEIFIRHPREFTADNRERNLRILRRHYNDATFTGRENDYKQHIRYNYGRELLGNSENEKAEYLFTEFIDNGGAFDYWAHFYRALCARDKTTRLSRLRACTFIDQRRAESYVEIGNLLIKDGLHRQAVNALRHAAGCPKDMHSITYNPDYTWRPYALLSVAYQGLGDEAQAAACWEQAHRLGLQTDDDASVVA